MLYDCFKGIFEEFAITWKVLCNNNEFEKQDAELYRWYDHNSFKQEEKNYT